MRFGRIFFILVILFCAVAMARLWRIMPEQMAAHFNIQGNPDRFVPKIQFFLTQIRIMLVVFLVSLPIQALFLVVPPNIVNMPNREYWLAPERRAKTMERIGDFGSTMFAIILSTIQAAFEISAYANLHTPIVFNARLMGLVLVISSGAILLMLIGLILSFRLPSSAD